MRVRRVTTLASALVAGVAPFVASVTASAQDHPDPRVIVNVVKVAGPHAGADLQREMRRQLWGKIIACYRPGALKNQALAGWTTVRFDVARTGKPRPGKLVKTTLKDKQVARCLAKVVAKAPLVPAKRASTVTAELYVAPGDIPMR